jgi:hypothetical protein
MYYGLNAGTTLNNAQVLALGYQPNAAATANVTYAGIA